MYRPSEARYPNGMALDSTRTQVVVIGSGQAGLSVAFYLQRLGLEPGVDFIVVDRNTGAGGAWQHRWEALRIGSAHRINDLPGMDALGISFENADRRAPAKEVVADWIVQPGSPNVYWALSSIPIATNRLSASIESEDMWIRGSIPYSELLGQAVLTPRHYPMPRSPPVRSS